MAGADRQRGHSYGRCRGSFNGAISAWAVSPSCAIAALLLQRDVRPLFPSYGQACKEADTLLFSVGRTEEVNTACSAAPIGKKTPEALYVHFGAIDQLPASLRVFEGCARAYIGRVDGANIVKLSRLEPKISYLSYPAFEDDPHPALAQSLSVHLQTFRVRTRDYSDFRNPPILHRKETFLPAEHPLRAKFARLTAAEEAKGLSMRSTASAREISGTRHWPGKDWHYAVIV